MKTTIRAILINVETEQIKIIDNLMSIFCSAIRFSFNRIQEGQKISDIEKNTAIKYKLNSRQSKDAVENARQIIASQKELLKLNYSAVTKKIETIKKQLLRPNLSDKKRKALECKLEKRVRISSKLKNMIEQNKIPSVIFGTKKLFIKRCKNQITNAQWKDIRDNRIYSRGDKTKNGNPNLRVITKEDENFLEISTIDKTKTNRAIKIQVPMYLPQKLSKKTGLINGINYKTNFLEYLKTGLAYQVEIIRKNNNYYCHITYEEPEPKLLYTCHNAVMGVDTNPNGFGLTVISKDGNYKNHIFLKEDKLQYVRTNKRENLCGELVNKVVDIAINNGCGIAIEDLKFKNDKDVFSKFARIKNQFVYSKLLEMLERACIRKSVEVVKVAPQYTSKIGLYKYCHQYGMVVHNGAAMVIARRSYGKSEKVPKLLKNKFITDTEKFNSKNEWARWAMISKLLLNRTNYTNAVQKELREMEIDIENKNKNKIMKGGTGFVANRKTILGINKKIHTNRK